MLAIKSIKISATFSSFVRKMAENIAKDCSMAQRVQYSSQN